MARAKYRCPEPEVADHQIRPPYKCFTCQDYGLINNSLTHEYIEGDIKIPMICTNPKCFAGQRWIKAYYATDRPDSPMTVEEYQACFDPKFPSYFAEDINDRLRSEWWDDRKNKPSTKRLEISESESGLSGLSIKIVSTEEWDF